MPVAAGAQCCDDLCGLRAYTAPQRKRFGRLFDQHAEAVAAATAALGLHHGPVHAECRVSGDMVYVLEVAARPIGCCRHCKREAMPLRMWCVVCSTVLWMCWSSCLCHRLGSLGRLCWK